MFLKLLNEWQPVYTLTKHLSKHLGQIVQSISRGMALMRISLIKNYISDIIFLSCATESILEQLLFNLQKCPHTIY